MISIFEMRTLVPDSGSHKARGAQGEEQRGGDEEAAR
jgi:hypothetical protein